MNAPARNIETSISESTFKKIAAIAHDEAGIILSNSKQSMVKSRLTKRLRALEIRDFDSYLVFLQNGQNLDEMKHFISALTTNVSHFFRETHHFDTLKKTILPELQNKLKRGEKVRIWSAGCSNGQEPYSIAMALLDVDETIAAQDIKILATDIDPEVLAHAVSGRYAGAMTSGLTDNVIKNYFSIENVRGEEIFQIKQQVKDLVSFRQLNLHADWPMRGSFDVIFCRNVVIYFDDATQAKLYKRFHSAMTENGWLLLGHSERLNSDSSKLFKSAGVTTYRPNLRQQNLRLSPQLET
ncbi:chemotaxis protein methyltransferase CheR [Pacificibacter maritimus]|uniref:Chemotaxis protein methyltransferase n=1 Tax=Pacificibacter maritimus TaxID=762213 RepID=A0A3N4UW16_9RHOB|nr:protein-glutamate O-methyltransferase CheR [Pacificibacter maritimus]RPE71721.1 chemotaxis protein methyltransferase CheR [Pacificibacter maritimus]